MHVNITRTVGLLAVALTALLVTACGTPAGAGNAGSGATEHNRADVTFVQAMIPHHAQAVAMAQLAAGQAAAPQVKGLAARIEQAQGPEIAQMRDFLVAWKVKEDPNDVDGRGMNPMSGMMSPEQMGRLGLASGAAFDRMFLQLMTEHHTGAVQMAETELREGRNGDAKALAQRIIDAQRAEIAQMQNLLTTS